MTCFLIRVVNAPGAARSVRLAALAALKALDALRGRVMQMDLIRRNAGLNVVAAKVTGHAT
ncbi:MAG: hypothetical protein L0387_06055 [Acidobacteria bacterium]|nr:hypothetical protein [Acidobacteriota bacterium]